MTVIHRAGDTEMFKAGLAKQVKVRAHVLIVENNLVFNGIGEIRSSALLCSSIHPITV